MNISQIVVQGILQADGTLLLNEMPNLPAGPVEVFIRSQPAANADAESWWEFLKRSHAEMVEQGYKFRTKEEIDADRDRQRCRPMNNGDNRMTGAGPRSESACSFIWILTL